MRTIADDLWNTVGDRLLYPGTNLIYDRVIGPGTRLPSAEDIAADIPNPNGYGTVMEDCMITGGTALHGLSIRMERDGTFSPLAERIADGMLSCAESGKEGFLPRGVHPLLKGVHYRDSSRDQLTMFLYGMLRYVSSGYCSERTAVRASAAAVRIAERAVRYVRSENGWELPAEDGAKALNGKMWGEGCLNHERFRLPLIYLTAYTLSRDELWYYRYAEIREEALQTSLPMTSYWALYTLQQMCVSLDAASRYDPDAVFGRRCGLVMDEAARFAASMTQSIREHIAQAPEEAFRERQEYTWFYYIQDAAILPMLEAAAPGVKVRMESKGLMLRALERLDTEHGSTALPVHFAAATEAVEAAECMQETAAQHAELRQIKMRKMK